MGACVGAGVATGAWVAGGCAVRVPVWLPVRAAGFGDVVAGAVVLGKVATRVDDGAAAGGTLAGGGVGAAALWGSVAAAAFAVITVAS